MAAYYTFEDLSGSASNGVKTDNPYHDLIVSCQNNPNEIASRYSTHRTNRNAQQKAKLLALDFPGVTIDQILHKLSHPDRFPGYSDPRYCLVFWARPTQAVKELIFKVQMRLKEVVPNLWIMPKECLHMTALEITHSRTEEEIEGLVEKMLPHAQGIVDYTYEHRAKLVKPCVSFDAQALALSWLPAADPGGDEYTYHHLRRDLFTLAEKTGVKVESRYVIPSAHLTIGRFIEKEDFEGEDGSVDRSEVARLVEVIEEINGELNKDETEWAIGQEKGLEFRKGPLWYGGGKMVRIGQGF